MRNNDNALCRRVKRCQTKMFKNILAIQQVFDWTWGMNRQWSSQIKSCSASILLCVESRDGKEILYFITT